MAVKLPAYPTEPYSTHWIRSWGLEANAAREAILAALEGDQLPAPKVDAAPAKPQPLQGC